MLWVKRIALTFLALVILAVVLVVLRSEYLLRKTHEASLLAVTVPSDSASVAEGHRLAATFGCTSCHGENVEGQVFFEDPMLGRFVAANLTRVVAEQSDGELERVIRRGIRTNGRSTLAMPSSMYQHLSDRDLGAILAYLRSLPPSEGPETEVKAGPMARFGLAIGMFSPQVEDIDLAITPPTERPTETLAVGEYLAMSTCTECHGQDLTGGFEGQAPDLIIATSYSDDEFSHFMTSGEALGGRELETMSKVARSRFSHFTPEEVRALHAFLRARAETGAEAPITVSR